MKKAVIFCNGKKEQILLSPLLNKKIPYEKSLMICADGGIRHAFSAFLVPHFVIGDLDSLSQKDREKIEKKKIKVITYPTDKDFTDSELALNFAIKKGCKKVFLLKTFGDRIDHFLSNLFLFEKFASLGIEIEVLQKNQHLFFLTEKKSSLKISGGKGDLISLLPLRGDCLSVKTIGLTYPLNEETLFYGSSRGVSNVFINTKAEIQLKKGSLLVVHTVSK
jgi:thiamine pyrophosphokinase